MIAPAANGVLCAAGPGTMLSCIRLCVVGQPEGPTDTPVPLDTESKSEPGAPKNNGKEDEPFMVQAMKLGFCALGLQVCGLEG